MVKNKFYEFELVLRRKKAEFLRPLMWLLTKIGLTANYLTLIGVLFSFATFYFIITNQRMYALVAFLVSYLFDVLDGSLAFYQHSDSDKGKFFDTLADSIAITAIALGLIYVGTISGLNGGLYIYLTHICLFLRVLVNSLWIKTDWLFKARAGVRAHIPKYVVFVFFILWCFGNLSNLNLVLYVLNIYMVLLAIFSFIQVVSHK
jgi:phosphatidylglycerophosphate synthase